jgi:hypothetical protein
MGINIDFSKKKVSAGYKTIYLKTDMIDAIEKIASKNDTSFNNVIVSMLEFCLKDGYNK